MNEVDPLTGQVNKSGEVGVCRKPLRLEPAHLARRSRSTMSRIAADDPAHGRIMPQALSVVHVLISSKAAEHRLPQQTDQRMAAVLARAPIGEHLARYRGQPECVVQFPIGQQSGVGGDAAAMEFQLQAAVKTQASAGRSSTHPLGPPCAPRSISHKMLYLIAELSQMLAKP